ncbi:MAG TPA: flagellar basal body-associated FliL family protein [Steroidobacteraceae bacterium]|nr:flagellar basal body-associated FliL family protein [Steroidobacteraceae bacterium]
MADIPTLEPAQDVPLADEEAPPPIKSSRLWIIIAVAVLMVAGAAGAGWHFLGASRKGAQKSAAAPPESGPALYVSLDPAFVTNFEADQAVRFLQISVEVMTHDPATVDVIKSNDPVLRNDLLLLFANQKYAEIATRDGKERLRAAALAAIRKDVAANGGHPERVDAVYFTSFVMQ